MIEPTFSSAPPAPTAPAPEEDVTTALYRAAIGPINANYYLPIFSRFEAADRAGISWNTAASLTTLNWLAFRQLWTAALAYVGIIVAVALLVFGIGRLVFQFSDTLVMALGLGFGLAAFVLPGLFGNAVLHAACRKKMSSALTAHTQVEDACAQLNRQAPTRQRAIWLACANAAFCIAAVFSYVQISALSTLAVMPQGALDAGHVTVGRTTDLSPAPAVPSTPAASANLAASAPASVPAAPMAMASATSLIASAPTTPTASAPTAPTLAVSAPAPVASAPLAATSVPAALPTSAPASVPASAPASTPAAKISASKAAPKASAPKASAPAQAERKKKEAEPTVIRAKKAQPPATTETPKRKASSAASTDTAEKPYFINVGLFAIPENAASAHAKLLEAQLPSVLKELKSTKGRQIRVRVGPYRSKADAQAAVEKIKALQLDAVIVQL